jgi:hypothetical protein
VASFSLIESNLQKVAAPVKVPTALPPSEGWKRVSLLAIQFIWLVNPTLSKIHCACMYLF